MKMHIYKYQGAGNDFVVVDNRRGESASLTPEMVRRLCDRRFGVGADGLMTLCAPVPGKSRYDFAMHYYNSDGPEGTMCGNGGRCLVAFAAHLGLGSYEFTACDGPHSASVVERDGDRMVVRLRMRDVEGVTPLPDGCFLDTGSAHFVGWVTGLGSYPVETEGPRLRYDARFPSGANVNFVEPGPDGLAIRTWERGVEAETWACGTGATAAAIASYSKGIKPQEVAADGRVRYSVLARGGRLAVDFIPSADGTFRDVWLTGPATRVFETDIDPETIVLPQ
ncbi:MAG: diaminopimelate epimerase [Bacteroidales bacterium]|nr:diaminopimelate epimerase [Bacteroidales bacterium]